MNKYLSTAKIWLIVCLSNAIFSAYVSAEITVDGRLDETEWKQAQRFQNFVETSPFSLKETTHPTEVLVLTDEKGIYLGLSTNSHGIHDTEGNKSVMQCGLIPTETSSLLILIAKPTSAIFLVSL